MPSNSDLKRWYKVFKVKDRDFVRYDNNFRILCFDAIDDFHAVNLGQMNEAIQKAIQSHAYDVKVKKIDFPYGELTDLTYDTENGLSMLGTTRLTEVDDETVDIETSRSIPLRAIDGLSMDVSEDGKHIEISGKNKSNATNLENGTGTGSLVQKRLKSDGVTWTTAKAYQQAGAAFGGGTQAGMTEDEFNAYFWDSVNNVPLHNGQGKNDSGEILDDNGFTYNNTYSFAFAGNEDNKALARGSAAFGRHNKTVNPGEFVCGNYSEEDRNPETVFLVGGGANSENRHNAFEVRTAHSSTANYSKAYIGGKEVATQDYVNYAAVNKQGNSYVVYINEANGKSTVMPYRFQKQSILDAEYQLMFQPMLDGRLYTRYPTDEYHAANKGYVDDIVSVLTQEQVDLLF